MYVRKLYDMICWGVVKQGGSLTISVELGTVTVLLFQEGSRGSGIEPSLEKVYGSDPTVGYGKLH